MSDNYRLIAAINWLKAYKWQTMVAESNVIVESRRGEEKIIYSLIYDDLYIYTDKDNHV